MKSKGFKVFNTPKDNLPKYKPKLDRTPKILVKHPDGITRIGQFDNLKDIIEEGYPSCGITLHTNDFVWATPLSYDKDRREVIFDKFTLPAEDIKKLFFCFPKNMMGLEAENGFQRAVNKDKFSPTDWAKQLGGK